MITKTIPVGRRSLAARVRRFLETQGKEFRASRHGGTTEFLIIDDEKIVRSSGNLEELAREIGCLRTWERMAG